MPLSIILNTLAYILFPIFGVYFSVFKLYFAWNLFSYENWFRELTAHLSSFSPSFYFIIQLVILSSFIFLPIIPFWLVFLSCYFFILYSYTWLGLSVGSQFCTFYTVLSEREFWEIALKESQGQFSLKNFKLYSISFHKLLKSFTL